MPHCHSLITIVTVTRHSLRRKKKQNDGLCGPGRSCLAVCCCRSPRYLATTAGGFGSSIAAPPLTAQLFQELLLPGLSIALCCFGTSGSPHTFNASAALHNDTCAAQQLYLSSIIDSAGPLAFSHFAPRPPKWQCLDASYNTRI